MVICRLVENDAVLRGWLNPRNTAKHHTHTHTHGYCTLIHTNAYNKYTSIQGSIYTIWNNASWLTDTIFYKTDWDGNAKMVFMNLPGTHTHTHLLLLLIHKVSLTWRREEGHSSSNSSFETASASQHRHSSPSPRHSCKHYVTACSSVVTFAIN